MSHTNLIRKSEDCFNLTQKIVKSLSETYKFNFEEGWKSISSQTIVKLQKKFKKQKRANNPLSSIKKPRTSFSFFTKENRNNIQKKNPTATFGDLSKLVSVEWKKLTEKELKYYKTLERKDKTRYASEKEELLNSIAKQENSCESKDTTDTTDTATITDESTSKTTSKTTLNKKDKGVTKDKGSTKSKTTLNKKDDGTTKQKGSYNVFQKQKRVMLKEKKFSLMQQNSELGKMWKALSVEEKSVFV